MEPRKHERTLDEANLAREVQLATEASESSRAAAEAKPVAGRQLPAGFANPECGAPGHLCVDPQGRYQPTWSALKIYKNNENMPQRQYFNMNGKAWYVTVGQWVDVPPEILTVLRYTEQQIISMDMTQSALQGDRAVPRVVDTVPRFSYNHIASA